MNWRQESEQNRIDPEGLSQTEQKPIFDGGAFTILHLSTDPEGFEVSTHQSLRIGQKTSPYDHLPLTPEERIALRDGMRKDRNQALETTIGRKITPLRKERAWAENVLEIAKGILDDEKYGKLKRQVDELVYEHAINRTVHETINYSLARRYSQLMSKSRKVGIAEMWQNGNTLFVKEFPVLYSHYNLFAYPDVRPEVRKLGRLSGTAIIVETFDGKLVVQHRSIGNNVYGDIPGASAAGLFDGPYDNRNPNPGTLPPVDTGKVKKQAMNEAREEIGVKHDGRLASLTTQTVKEFASEKVTLETTGTESNIAELRITGFAFDNVRPHGEFLLYAKSTLTADEFLQEARNARKQGNKTGYDFFESFEFIDATPEAIENLSQMRCPIPPTHSAAFVATGYAMVLERDGLEKAKNWKKDMEQKYLANWNEINQTVRRFYQEHPEAITKNVKRGKQANHQVYDPDFPPEVQGLPSFDTEFARLHLEAEVQKTVEEALLFDVDGVITHVTEKLVKPEDILDSMIKALELGYPIALNTGRAASWVLERVIEPLKERIQTQDKSPKILSNLLVLGEMGGVVVEMDKKGNPIIFVDGNLSIPARLKDAIKQLIETKYSHAMFYDKDKETMSTAEMNPGYNFQEFKDLQKEFFADVRSLVESLGFNSQVKVDKTTIATDIQDVKAGKGLGARKFLEWTRKKNLNPRLFRTFGDSDSDEAMAQELYDQGEDVVYVFVGRELADKQRGYEVLTPQETYSEVTARYLGKLLAVK